LIGYQLRIGSDGPILTETARRSWSTLRLPARLLEKRSEVERLSNELANAEAELNDRVYQLFNLTQDEIKLLQREVEH
jgi:hypothetical protein